MKTKNKKYNIEFFHIYTDEKISKQHTDSINFLKLVKPAWDFDFDLVVLIDNYNPTTHITNELDVLDFLHNENSPPDFFAYEGDMLANAGLLLETITSRKLKKSYDTYISSRSKYPCSLLTATWYLTRLGCFGNEQELIRTVSGKSYVASDRLVNILPADYKPVELRALELIRKSAWSSNEHNIQDLFYDSSSNRALELF